MVLYKKICLKESEVWLKVMFQTNFVFTLVTEDLPSSFLSRRPVAYVHFNYNPN